MSVSGPFVRVFNEGIMAKTPAPKTPKTPAPKTPKTPKKPVKAAKGMC